MLIGIQFPVDAAALALTASASRTSVHQIHIQFLPFHILSCICPVTNHLHFREHFSIIKGVDYTMEGKYYVDCK